MSSSINLKYRYSKAAPAVLNGANAVFEKGKISVLLGLNGSGKTTLIKLLAGLYRPDEGQITYEGRAADLMSIKERSRRIAYVAQQFGRIDDFTVSDYIRTVSLPKRSAQRFLQTRQARLQKLGVCNREAFLCHKMRLMRKRISLILWRRRRDFELCTSPA